MKFSINNGLGLISIGMSDIGSYFSFNDPLTVVWHDCRGSIGKYIAFLPYSEAYRQSVREKIQENLTTDFSTDIQGLHDLLQPLFPLFKNGEYHLHFLGSRSKEFFEYDAYTHPSAEEHFSMDIVTGNPIDISKADEVLAAHEKASRSKDPENTYSVDVLDHTSDWIYETGQTFYATEPASSIDAERVKYFEEKITAGERPFAILINEILGDSASKYFILDGHHKLLAYQKLNIYPSLAFISHLPASESELVFDAEKLAGLLYPWQTRHLLKNWDSKDDYIIERLKDPQSKLHAFIKNGYTKELHKNGKLKHEGFYINDHPEGTIKEWFDNGKLKYEHIYENRLRKGTWKDYFPSGKLQFVQPFNEDGRYHGELISYYESGAKKFVQLYENGQHADGVSYRWWFENGDKEAELTHKNGQMMSRKNWNSYGQFVNHEEYDESQHRLVKKDIPPAEANDLASKNYSNRQKELRLFIDSKNKLKQNTGDTRFIIKIILLIIIALIFIGKILHK